MTTPEWSLYCGLLPTFLSLNQPAVLCNCLQNQVHLKNGQAQMVHPTMYSTDCKRRVRPVSLNFCCTIKIVQVVSLLQQQMLNANQSLCIWGEKKFAKQFTIPIAIIICLGLLLPGEPLTCSMWICMGFAGFR